MDIVWDLVSLLGSKVQSLWYSHSIYYHTSYDERYIEVGYVVSNKDVKHSHDVTKLYKQCTLIIIDYCFCNESASLVVWSDSYAYDLAKLCIQSHTLWSIVFTVSIYPYFRCCRLCKAFSFFLAVDVVAADGFDVDKEFFWWYSHSCFGVGCKAFNLLTLTCI